ncbi:MAG: DUF3343 domain-containing protein [Treponema sp.]|jgi:hypothetical protein|nr:DUF3343 domain-containing protein [Treponema sp.]
MTGPAQVELIICFHTSHDAIVGERLLLDSGLDVRVMPMPPELGPACGIALRLAADSFKKAGDLLGETIADVYCRSPEAAGEFIRWKP